MSHISVLKTAFADRDLLLQALRELGYEVTEGENLSITDGIRSVKVDFLVQIPYTEAVGFQKGKNGWRPAADWFRVNIDRKAFENRIKQQYAYLSVRQSLESQGFTIAEEERNTSRQIHIVLRRVSA